jgi:hypothetical protein
MPKKGPEITLEYLLAHTIVQAPPPHLNTPCRIWQGTREGDGYPTIRRRVNGKIQTFRVHRLVLKFTRGEDLGSLHGLHKCDVPSCISPDHLFSGGYKENARDCAAKKRGNKLKGERNILAKLTQEEVHWLRQIANTRTLSSRRIGRIFKICHTTVAGIISGRTWNDSYQKAPYGIPIG